MKKEIISRGTVKNELLKLYVQKIISKFVWIPIAIFVNQALLGILSALYFSYLPIDFDVVFSKIYYSLLAFVLFLTALPSIIGYLKAMRDKFNIETEKLVSKYRRHKYSILSLFSTKRCTLIFENSGAFFIPVVSYRWSRFFKMDDNTVYDKAEIDDEFYTVSVGKQKAIFAYNKKDFILDTEIPQQD